MIYFRQLFDKPSSTYTYLLGDMTRHEAMLIDPVREHVALYHALLEEQNLTLCSVLETSVHADHITGASALRTATGAQTVVNIHGCAPCATGHVAGGETLHFGAETVAVLATPGHPPAIPRLPQLSVARPPVQRRRAAHRWLRGHRFSRR